MTRAALLTLIICAALPQSAGAITIHAPENYDTQRLLQQWADEASQHVPMPNRGIRVRLQRCSKPESAGAACVHYGRWGQIVDFPAEFVALVGADDVAPGITLNVKLAFLHELGHVADVQPGRRPWRAAFRGVFGLRTAITAAPRIGFRGINPWVVAYTPENAVARPMEWFADAYAFCAVWPHQHPGPTVSDYDYQPTPEQHDRACRVVRAMRFD